MARKSTPDIMSSLMGSDYSQQEDNLQEDNIQEDHPQEIKQANNKAVKPVSNTARKAAMQSAVIQEGGNYQAPTTKATFNLSNETLDILEEVWFSLRKRLRSKRITKTAIVEAAIELALAEYEAKGEKAKLFKKLDN